MKTTTYIGQFKSNEGHTYKLKVECFGFLEAFFLLTANAIRSGNHYQLETIIDENNNIRYIDDILNCIKLIKFDK